MDEVAGDGEGVGDGFACAATAVEDLSAWGKGFERFWTFSWKSASWPKAYSKTRTHEPKETASSMAYFIELWTGGKFELFQDV